MRGYYMPEYGKERERLDILEHNRIAWNKNVDSGNEWTKPVSKEAVDKARNGEWELFLTPTRPVPRSWFPPLNGLKVLCLASGGGQQGPVLAAAGADVTVYDYSEKQLEQDRYVAGRDGLTIKTVRGDMANLACFADGSFDFIVHPTSNVFAESIIPVWKEAARVLRDGGILISGFVNPLVYIFDIEAEERGVLEVKHKFRIRMRRICRRNGWTPISGTARLWNSDTRFRTS